MSQTFTGEDKKQKIEWEFTVHPDGTLSFALTATRVRVSAVRGRAHYSILDLARKIDPALSLDGFTVQPRLILKLYTKLSQRDQERQKWGKIRKLSRRK